MNLHEVTLLTLTELSWLSGPHRSAESPALHAAASTLWLALPNKTSLECLSGQPFSSPAHWGAKALRSHSVRHRANVNSGEPQKQAAADQLIHDSVATTASRRFNRKWPRAAFIPPKLATRSLRLSVEKPLDELPLGNLRLSSLQLISAREKTENNCR